MEIKSFFNYLMDKFNLIGGVVGFIIIIVTYVKSHDFFKSLSLLLGLLTILLIYSLYSMFKDLKKLKITLNTKDADNQKLQNSYDEIEQVFNNQSEKYASNISELNKHKSITHLVNVLINSELPETKEGKRIINQLSQSVELALRESE